VQYLGMVITKGGCYITMSWGHCTLVQSLSHKFVFSLPLKTKVQCTALWRARNNHTLKSM